MAAGWRNVTNEEEQWLEEMEKLCHYDMPLIILTSHRMSGPGSIIDVTLYNDDQCWDDCEDDDDLTVYHDEDDYPEDDYSL